MGKLTDLLVEDTAHLLDELFDKLTKLEGQRDYVIETLGLSLAHMNIERLSFYDRERYLQYAIRFNELLMGKKDFLPHEVRDLMYSPKKDEEASFKILTGTMSQALLAVEDNPKSFEKKEVYLYLLQKLAPLNFPVSQGYAELFNQHQKGKVKRKGEKYYQLFDRGSGQYTLSLEKN